jgi:hypothetical protein
MLDKNGWQKKIPSENRCALELPHHFLPEAVKATFKVEV